MKAPEFDDASSERATQRRLYITIVAGLLVFLFAGWLVRSVFAPNASWKEAEFEQALHRFEEHLMLARVEWMRQGRPPEIELMYADWDSRGMPVEPIAGSVRVLMSRDGWPEARADGQAGCFEIWNLLARPEPLREELRVEYLEGDRLAECHFYYANILEFVFYPENGRVVKKVM
ncbi:MAG: MSH system platform protein MshF [Idiomarinaceae bacterium HL-53]|nr:MAG: MSH system platform protein MshF [Idiomarinaceae bacterium HL-53]CUS47463.1 hypothetical protein Ga0003345_0390 [Idiomarinaceae bacterium HL-53]